MQNYTFVLVSLVLFLLIPLSNLFTSLKLLFGPFYGGANYYGFIALGFFFLEFLVWRAFKLKSSLAKSNKRGIRAVIEGYKKIIEDVSIFIGSRKVSRIEALIGIVVGVSCGITTVTIMSYFENLSVGFLSPDVFLKMLISMPIETIGIYLVPVFEELVFRGFFLSRFLDIFKKRKMMVVALIMSSFIFGYIHSQYPIYKVLVGFVLGIVYLWKWKKNIVPSTIAHVTGNVFLTFVHTL